MIQPYTESKEGENAFTGALACLGVGLLVFMFGMFCKVHVINHHAAVLPYVDQWAGTIQQNLLHGAGLLDGYNGHRLLWSRLWDLALFNALGRFDNPIQCYGNAVIHCGTIAALCAALVASIGVKAFWPMLGIGCAVLGFPFAWENTISGFQSQAYFYIAFNLAVIVAFVYGKWHTFAILSVCSLFTLASGFFGPLACAILSGAIYLRTRTFEGAARGIAGVAAVLAVGACVQSGGMVWPEYYVEPSARNVGEFVKSFAQNLAWPICDFWPFGIALLLPIALLIRSPVSGHGKARYLVFLLALWSVMNAAAIAWQRCNGGGLPPSRYQDYLAVLPLASTAACALLVVSKPWGIYLAWIEAAVIAVAFLTWPHSDSAGRLRVRDALNQQWDAATLSIAAYPNPENLSDQPGMNIPYRDPRSFGLLLRDERVKRWVPQLDKKKWGE